MRQKKLVILIVVLCNLFFKLDDLKGNEEKLSWPIEIEAKNGAVVTLYQPQLESFEDDILEGRMAVVVEAGENDPVYGAVWFKARLNTNWNDRTALLEEMEIEKTYFPGEIEAEKMEKFKVMLSHEIESWNLEMSLDRILASMNEVENMKQLSTELDNTPPKIYYRDSPALLILIDGDPIMQQVENEKIEYVVNTPFLIVKDTKGGMYYINGGDYWYKSQNIKSEWSATTKVPSTVKKFAEKNKAEIDSEADTVHFSSPPELIVETESAELILVDGKADYKSIDGTSLLYLANSENDVIMDINSQFHYVLFAGRWYYTKSLESTDWTFCEPEDLPAEFKLIPENSEMGNVRSSIPGTSEAETALLEQSIPQTATVNRKETTVEVTYDGKPQFEKVSSTGVSYALNSNKTVLLINNQYYCVDDAIWFVSDNAKGPWEVSTTRPDEVDQLPPESPVYNVKYVYIYDYTPDVVYSGYLPGYNYSYVYGGTVVYGTGYRYAPWHGTYYYPRPVTWGYGVHYNPYTGWGFSISMSYGWIHWNCHPNHGGYWGPRGYYWGYRYGYPHGPRPTHRPVHQPPPPRGHPGGHRNVYNQRPHGVSSHEQRPVSRPPNNVNNRGRPTNKPNNMYTDRNGNVYKRNNDGSYSHQTNERRPSAPGNPSTNRPSNQQRPANKTTGQERSSNNPGQRPGNNSVQQRPGTGQPSNGRPASGQGQKPNTGQISQKNKQQLERTYQNRQRGTQNYNRMQNPRGPGNAKPANAGPTNPRPANTRPANQRPSGGKRR